MKIYDKAVWHIDGDEDADIVISRFREVFAFLNEVNMLNDEGKESFEYGMDSSISLNSKMVNEIGKSFLDNYYDIVLKKNIEETKANLILAYKEFTTKV